MLVFNIESYNPILYNNSMSISLQNSVTRVITAMVPAIVRESIGHNSIFRHNHTDIESIVESVTAKVTSECAIDIMTKTDEASDPPNLTPIQNLKIELYEMMLDMRDTLYEDLRLSIKEEIRMELFTKTTRSTDQPHLQTIPTWSSITPTIRFGQQ